jgi:hypothetical protein
MKERTEGWLDVKFGQDSYVLRIFNPKLFTKVFFHYNFDTVINLLFKQSQIQRSDPLSMIPLTLENALVEVLPQACRVRKRLARKLFLPVGDVPRGPPVVEPRNYLKQNTG